MDFKGVEPFVRYIAKSSDIKESEAELVSYDHMLIYVLSGELEMIAGKNRYRLEESSLLFVHSGVNYQVQHAKKADGILIHFDFKSDRRMEYPTYIRPVPLSEFEKRKIVEPQGTDSLSLEEVFCLEKVYELEHFLQYILLEEKQQEKYFDIIGSSLLKIVLAYAGRGLEEKHQESEASRHDVVAEVIAYLSKNLEKELSNELLGRQFGFHPKYINYLFEKETGYSIHKYVRVKRISRAIEYIQTTDRQICEIAEKLGFSDVKYFAKVFKSMVGKTPQEYRKMVQAARE
jgi:YesN/AraC family two-component response regulator